MDTLIAKGEESRGVDDQRYCVVMLDEATYYTDAFPGAKRNDAESGKALNEYEGPRDMIKSVYSSTRVQERLSASGTRRCYARSSYSLPAHCGREDRT